MVKFAFDNDHYFPDWGTLLWEMAIYILPWLAIQLEEGTAPFIHFTWQQMMLYFVLESFSNFLTYWVTLKILDDYGIAVL